MGEIQEVANRHRARLRSSETKALSKMNASYQKIEKELMDRANALLESVRENPSVSNVLSLKRTKEMLSDVERLLGDHADQVLRPTIINMAEDAITDAATNADELIRAALGPTPTGVLLPIAKLTEAQVAEIVATTSSGPLSKLLNNFGKVAAEKARQDLILGLALGEHPSKVARRLRRSLQISNQRANLIARTEQLRAYREATRTVYQNNSHLVTKWIWSASASPRTCAACWALHGQEFDTNTPMANHPACRCSMVPKTKTWKELGFSNVPETRPPFPKGEDLFATQPDSVKRAVLGPNAFAAYQNGDVSLSDFIHVDHSKEWGTTYRRGSLANALK